MLWIRPKVIPSCLQIIKSAVENDKQAQTWKYKETTREEAPAFCLLCVIHFFFSARHPERDVYWVNTGDQGCVKTSLANTEVRSDEELVC